MIITRFTSRVKLSICAARYFSQENFDEKKFEASLHNKRDSIADKIKAIKAQQEALPKEEQFTHNP